MSTKITIKEVDYSVAQEFSKKHYMELFNEPTEITSDELFTDFNKEKISKLRKGHKNKKYGFLIYHNETIIGWHLGTQSKPVVYHMVSSAILKTYQGKGYYKTLLNEVIRRIKEKGYVAITSLHSATNNKILVPKLKYGFYIQGFEIQTNYGLAVNLIYYLNKKQKNAHELRVGSRPSLSPN